MLDQIEPLPDDAPSGPGTLTNQAKVKQSQNTKRPSKEQKLNFKTFFFAFNYILGSISWSITLFYFNYTGSNVSSACPHRMNYGEKYLYEQNFSFDLHAFINDDETNLIWNKSKLTYGDLQSTFRFNTKVPISEVSSMSPVVLLFDNYPLISGSSSKLNLNLSFSVRPKQWQPLPARLSDQKRLPACP